MRSEPEVRDGAVGATLAGTDPAAAPASMDDFRVGLSHGDVRAYAQPVVELGSGLVVGYRGIARWHHRRLGALEASAFIDMIADTPLASQVDLYVAREMAAVLTLAVGDEPLRLYTPVSRRLIADVRTEQYLSEIADAYFLSIDQMRLQVARSLLDRWSPALQDALESLRDAGVGLVLTGVEHASDAQDLAARPFDELHIAPHLTRAAATDTDARRAVSEIVRLARDGALPVAATGVGDRQQHDLLVEAGCSFASGDFYARPEPADTIY
jgi:EAL domain-containing protein (putative c-di-GMP-specific phosphodiesterase class I)